MPPVPPPTSNKTSVSLNYPGAPKASAKIKSCCVIRHHLGLQLLGLLLGLEGDEAVALGAAAAVADDLGGLHVAEGGEQLVQVRLRRRGAARKMGGGGGEIYIYFFKCGKFILLSLSSSDLIPPTKILFGTRVPYLMLVVPPEDDEVEPLVDDEE